MKRFLIFAWMLSSMPLVAQEVPVEKKPEETPAVVITASRLEERLEEVGSSVTLVGSAQLEGTQQRTLTGALRTVPSVDAIQSGPLGGATSVFLRGTNSEHTLVLVDGVEANDAMGIGRAFDFAHFPTDNVEQIEIIRGPQSVLYGSDAMGGVINVITKRGKGDPRVTADGEAGSYGTYRARASLSGGTDRVHYSLAASRVQTGGISSADSDLLGNSERDGYRNSSVSTRIGVTPTEFFEIDFYVRSIQAEAETDSGAGPGMDDPNHAIESDQTLFKVEPRLLLFDGLWEQKLGVSLNETDRVDDDAFDTAHPIDLTFTTFEARTFDVDWQHNLYWHESNTVTVGMEWEEDTGESFFHSESAFGPFTSIFDREKVHTAGFYAQDKVTLGDRFWGTVGVRVDDHEDYGTQATWRLTGAYLLTETDTRLRATLGTGFKSPSLFQLFSSFGNPDLDPEEGLGWDAGIDQALADGAATLGLTVFRNELEDLIQFDGGTGKYANLARVETEGVEFAAEVRPLDDLELRATYSFLQTDDNATDRKLIRRSPHKAGFQAIYGFLENASAFASVLFVDDRPDLDFTTFPSTRVALDDYVLVDVGGSYKVVESIELFGRVENLLDKDYEDVQGYGTPRRAVYVGIGATY